MQESIETTIPSPNPARTDATHLQVGGYFRGLMVHSILGEGAMGAAYLASHPVLQMPLVIKTFKGSVDTNIFREAHLAARVTSPNVVSVLDTERLLGDHPQTEVLQDRKYVGKDDRVSGAVNAQSGQLAAGFRVQRHFER